MRVRRLLGPIAIAGSALAALPAVGHAQATTVTCGQVITQNTTLANDLTDCPGNGLRVAADDITLDLNGHTIDGDGADGQAFEDLDGGIVNGFSPQGGEAPAVDGVTVMNGTIRDFESPVTWFSLEQPISGGTITGLTVQGGGGIELTFADDVRVEGNTLMGAAIGLTSSNRNRVTSNRIAEGGITVDKVQSRLPGVAGNVIAGNTVLDSPSIGIDFGAQSFEDEPQENRIVSNTVRRSAGNGIQVLDNAVLVIEGNTVTGSGGDGLNVALNGFGIETYASTVTDNVADSNTGLGVNAADWTTDGGGNRAEGNGDPRQCVNVVCRPHAFLFGGGNPGASFSAMTSNAKRATRFFLFFPATVSQLRAYLDGGGAGSGSQLLRGVIYADAGGQPGPLLGRSFQGAISAGFGPGWATLPLPYRLKLQPGYYWLGLHSGATNGAARFGWNPRANSRRFNLDSFGDGPSNPFGAAALDDQAMAIHTIGYVRPGN